jgi:hypothetical protein
LLAALLAQLLGLGLSHIKNVGALPGEDVPFVVELRDGGPGVMVSLDACGGMNDQAVQACRSRYLERMTDEELSGWGPSVSS